MEKVSKPFFLTLQRWIFAGELHDPFNEFFVQLNPEVGGDDTLGNFATGDAGFEEGFDAGGGVSDARHIWEKKYVFVKAMIPGFINEDFGKKVCVPQHTRQMAADPLDLLHWAQLEFHQIQLLRLGLGVFPGEAGQLRRGSKV